MFHLCLFTYYILFCDLFPPHDMITIFKILTLQIYAVINYHFNNSQQNSRRVWSYFKNCNFSNFLTHVIATQDSINSASASNKRALNFSLPQNLTCNQNFAWYVPAKLSAKSIPQNTICNLFAAPKFRWRTLSHLAGFEFHTHSVGTKNQRLAINNLLRIRLLCSGTT